MSKVYTVGQINGYINNLISSDYILKNICVEGEVSNCSYKASGHIYFSLKDETGSMPAVMFHGNVKKGLTFTLENGQKVRATGRIGVYERDGRYQLYVTTIDHAGRGNLYEEYERLKQKLYEQGLFDFEIKKPIPKYPRQVGIVTSDTGAAIRDIENIAARRNPFVQLILYPAKVQGDGAAAEIAEGIRVLDRMGLDTIIVGRGGGSIEDLWAFNEEEVVWAIYEAQTPIISGTGHEIDNTLADYAADLRAPTPSAACELALPDIMSVYSRLDALDERISDDMYDKLQNCKDRLTNLERSLRYLNPAERLKSQKQRLMNINERLDTLIRRAYDNRLGALKLVTARIHGASPTAKLTHGYGYIEDMSGRPVLHTKDLEVGDDIRITMHDGQVSANITKV